MKTKFLVSFTIVRATLDQHNVKRSKLTGQLPFYLSVAVSVDFGAGSQKETPGWIDRQKIFRLLTLKLVLLVALYLYVLPETLRKHDEGGKRGTAFCKESRGIAFVVYAAKDSAQTCDTLVA